MTGEVGEIDPPRPALYQIAGGLHEKLEPVRNLPEEFFILSGLHRPVVGTIEGNGPKERMTGVRLETGPG